MDVSLVVFVIIYCFFFIITVSETFNCGSANEFKDLTMNCAPNENCTLICDRVSCCRDATLVCPANNFCEVECSGINSCSNIMINATAALSSVLTITAASSTQGSIIICPIDGQCTVIANANNSFQSSSVYCPQPISNAVNCNISSNTTLAYNALDFITIYAIEPGSLSVKCTGDEDPAYCTASGNSIHLYCTETFSENCSLSFFDFKCANNDSVCVDYTLPSTDPSIYPSNEPTVQPTDEPTIEPTVKPTVEPTVEPTIDPTVGPTVEPTTEPTVPPTIEPSVEPTTKPTIDPTISYFIKNKNKYNINHAYIAYTHTHSLTVNLIAEGKAEEDSDAVAISLGIIIPLLVIAGIIVAYFCYKKKTEKDDRNESVTAGGQITAIETAYLGRDSTFSDQPPRAGAQHINPQSPSKLNIVHMSSDTDCMSNDITISAINSAQAQKSDSSENIPDIEEKKEYILKKSSSPAPALPPRPKYQLRRRITFVGDANQELAFAHGGDICTLRSFESVQGYNGSLPKALVLLEQKFFKSNGYQTAGIFDVKTIEQNIKNKNVTNDGFTAADGIQHFFTDLGSEDGIVVESHVLQRESMADDMHKVVDNMDEPYSSILVFVWDICGNVANNEPKTHMNAQQLADVFAPIITRSSDKETNLSFAKGIEWRMKTINS